MTALEKPLSHSPLSFPFPLSLPLETTSLFFLLTFSLSVFEKRTHSVCIVAIIDAVVDLSPFSTRWSVFLIATTVSFPSREMTEKSGLRNVARKRDHNKTTQKHKPMDTSTRGEARGVADANKVEEEEESLLLLLEFVMRLCMVYPYIIIIEVGGKWTSKSDASKRWSYMKLYVRCTQ